MSISHTLESLHHRYFTVKGHIQSGKTRFIIETSRSLLALGLDVVVIVRNNRADREQLLDRLGAPDKRIRIALGNHSSITAVRETLKQPFALFLDEVDAVDSGTEAKKTVAIAEIKALAYCCFGVSGTVMDVIAKERVMPDTLIQIPIPPAYKGIVNNKITMKTLPSSSRFAGKTGDDLFQTMDLTGFLGEYLKKETPRLCLFTITDCILPCENAQETITHLYPTVATIVYNGNGILFRKGEERRHYAHTPLSMVLQRLKDEGHQTLLIFAGELAGRGLSFVSRDRGWHLTDQVLLVSKGTDEPELMQRIRLCGVYDDDWPLTLYSTEATLTDLRKACFRQEEYIEAVSTGDGAQTAREIVEALEMSRKKFTSRKMVKDSTATMAVQKTSKEVGWSTEIYGIVSKEVKETSKDDAILRDIHRLLSGKASKEATFLALLSPTSIYSKNELIDLLGRANYLQPASMFRAVTSPTETWGKRYFEEADGGYRIRPCLVTGWQ